MGRRRERAAWLAFLQGRADVRYRTRRRVKHAIDVCRVAVIREAKQWALTKELEGVGIQFCGGAAYAIAVGGGRVHRVRGGRNSALSMEGYVLGAEASVCKCRTMSGGEGTAQVVRLSGRMNTAEKATGTAATQLPKGALRMDERTLASRAGGKWFASHPPEAVAFPRGARRFANSAVRQQKQNSTHCEGAGYGYVGGCVPVRGGIALSLKKMNRIREISADDFVAVVQPGVITAELQEAVEAKRLYYPPDPASRTDCSIGGNIATNAGGPRCLKYGVTRDYVLGLEVVLPDGSIAKLGGRCHKNKTGFDLARFFVGSEGLLGVVTEATLKLLPKPPFRVCLGLVFGLCVMRRE